MNGFDISLLLSMVVAGAAPILLAAAGETISEKSGVTNLSLDGTIILSAMVAFAVASQTDSLLTGFAAASAAGAAVSTVTAFFSSYSGQSQIAIGLALAFMTRDLAYFMGTPYAGIKELVPRIPHFPVPYLSDIPYIGKIFFNHDITVYISLAAVFTVWIFICKTGTGLRIRAVGENPEAAIARGLNPVIIRFCCSVCGGFFTGLAGASFSLAAKAGWGQPQGCEGSGWIALALVVSGGGNLSGATAGAFLFSFLQVVCFRFQDWFPGIPAHILQISPFPLMIFALIIINTVISLKKGGIKNHCLFAPPFR